MASISEILANPYLNIAAKALAIGISAIVLNTIFSIIFKQRISANSKVKDIEEKRLHATRIDLGRKATKTLIYGIAIVSILFLIPGVKTFSISLLAGAGIAAIVIGFAAQRTIANIVAGISIAVFTPFRINDRIKVGEEIGDVEELTLRHIIIRTWDNRRLIIPNSIIAEREIINYSIKEEKVLWTLDMGISYDSDIDKARKIMLKLANKHPKVIIPEEKEGKGVLKKEPMVRITECGDFAVNCRLFFWVESPLDAWATQFELTEQIKKEFDNAGIEIPFPYRTIVYKSDIDKQKKKK